MVLVGEQTERQLELALEGGLAAAAEDAHAPDLGVARVKIAVWRPGTRTPRRCSRACRPLDRSTGLSSCHVRRTVSGHVPSSSGRLKSGATSPTSGIGRHDGFVGRGRVGGCHLDQRLLPPSRGSTSTACGSTARRTSAPAAGTSAVGARRTSSSPSRTATHGNDVGAAEGRRPKRALDRSVGVECQAVGSNQQAHVAVGRPGRGGQAAPIGRRPAVGRPRRRRRCGSPGTAPRTRWAAAARAARAWPAASSRPARGSPPGRRRRAPPPGRGSRRAPSVPAERNSSAARQAGARGAPRSSEPIGSSSISSRGAAPAPGRARRVAARRPRARLTARRSVPARPTRSSTSATRWLHRGARFASHPQPERDVAGDVPMRERARSPGTSARSRARGRARQPGRARPSGWGRSTAAPGRRRRAAASTCPSRSAPGRRGARRRRRRGRCRRAP